MKKVIITLDIAKSEFEKKGCVLLSPKYVNNSTKMKYRCKCGEEKEVTYHGFINRKTGCRDCVQKENAKQKPERKPRSGNRVLTIDIVKKEFEDAGCILLSKTYKNNRENLSYICSCGEQSEKSYNCFQYKKGCMSCTGTPKYKLEQVQEFFKQAGCVLISQSYENTQASMDYICSCKTPGKISLSNLLRGHRCRNCRTYYREYTKESVKEAFEEENYVLHDEYVEYDKNMKYTCVSGHENQISWRKFLNGVRCSYCQSTEIEETQEQSSSTDVEEQSSSTDVGVVPFTFEGIFRGREKEIRITPDKQISVFDFIRVVGNQKNYKDAWKRILENHENEIVAFCDYSQFGKTKKTPVISVQGMVKLLFWIPGETAKQFRSKSAEVMIRYLGGDLTLIDEIRSVDQHHRENPDNVARVFREEVVLFNQDQINISNRLINHFGNKTDIFYLFSFKHSSEWYAKFGIVGEVREFHKRITEHKTEFENICFHHVIQCSNVYKIESEFKESALYSINKAKIPKKNGGFHVEILKLSESVTSDVIASEITKIAGDRILDPPPEYPSQTNVSLEVEKEKTKQLEIQSKSQIRLAELSNQLELEKLRISLEIEKLKNAKLT